ncbi:GNAT family N-acetyltransferase [Xanthobacter autotrophicus]|uniref:GNAT family N-acetyltransferase n=1 Tax=Xanthobacter autotrophicus TaxID=280 RepID=UPI001E64B18B|nr:GNAT family N-acyltransferase [Xanthobacter autotrophicus]UDQ89736.1 GNAT family N-acetyltransferase [Xanthobacter autotrophicus]
MKRMGQPDPGFNLPALFGRGFDVARDAARDFARDFAKDLKKDFGREGAAPMFGTEPGAFPFLRAQQATPAGRPALPGPQKLVTDFRAYSGLRHRDAVPTEPASIVLGRLGALEVRLARTARDVRRAQRLRYKVFYEEMSATPDATTRLARRDMDSFDTICDHILVLDHDAGKIVLGRRKPKVVGTYRLLRQEVANRHGGFYTQGEFDVGGVIAAHPTLRFLELGRSCVLKPYRNKRTVELLWHGVWTYILRNKIDAMFGCASLEGTDPAELDLPLSFLHHNAMAPEEWRARAVEGRHVSMDRMAKADIDMKKALQALPPLIKGYLRLGGFVGDGAVVDHQFGTTDVLIILPVSVISPRYVEHFGPTANRHAI